MQVYQDEIRRKCKSSNILPRIVQVYFFYRLAFDVHPDNYVPVDIATKDIAEFLSMPASEVMKYRKRLIDLGRLEVVKHIKGRHTKVLVKAVPVKQKKGLGEPPDYKTITDAQGDLERTLMQMAQENNRQKEEAA